MNDFVSSEIRGSLLVDKIEVLNIDRIVARNVAIFDPKGERVVAAEEVIIIPGNILSILNNQLRIDHVTVKNSMIHVIKSNTGTPTLIQSFESASPLPKRSDSLLVIVEDIRLSDATVYGDLFELYGFHVQDVSAQGRMELKDEIEIDIRAAKGVFSQPFPFKGHIDHLSGTINTNSSQGIHLQIDARRGSERAHALVRYLLDPNSKNKDQQNLHVAVEASSVSPDTVKGLGYQFIGPWQSPFNGVLRLDGPTDDLDLEADLKTEAGGILLNGNISEKEGIFVRLQTESLKLSKAIRKAPNIRVSGSTEVRLAPDQLYPQIHFQVEPVLYETIAIPSFELHGVLEEDRLRIDGLSSKQPSSLISGRGEIGFDGHMDLHVQAHITDIGSDRNVRRHLPNAKGGVDANLHLVTHSIDQKQVDLQGRIVLINVQYGPFNADRLELKGSAHGDPDLPRVILNVNGTQVSLLDHLLGDTEFSLKGGPNQYTADGYIRLKGHEAFKVVTQISANRGGFIVNAEPIELTIGDQSWRGVAHDLRITKGRSINLELLRLANRSQRLEMKGTIEFNGPDAIHATLQDFDLAVLRAFIGRGIYLEAGRADATVQLGGDISNPQIFLQGALRDGTYSNIQNIGAVYFLTYQENKFEIDAELDFSKRGGISVSGTGLLDSDRTSFLESLLYMNYHLNFNMTNFDITLPEQFIDKQLDWFEGRVNGKTTFFGTVYQPFIQADLRFDPLNIEGVSQLSAELQLTLAKNQLESKIVLADSVGTIGQIELSNWIDWNLVLSEPENITTRLMEGPWKASGNTNQRRFDSMPKPFSNNYPWPLAVNSQFQASKEQGKISAEVWFEGNWEESMQGTKCGKDFNPSIVGQALLYDGLTHFSVSGYSGKYRFADIEGTVQTPIDKWLESGQIGPFGSLTTQGMVEIPQIEKFPWICEYGMGRLKAQLDLDQLFTEQTFGYATVTSNFFPQGRIYRDRSQGKQSFRQIHYCLQDPLKIDLDMEVNPDELSFLGNFTGCGSRSSQLKARLPIEWIPLSLVPEIVPDKDLLAEAQFEKTQLGPILDQIPGISSSEVTLDGDVTATGKLANIHFGGELDISRGAFQLESTGQHLSKIKGKAVFHDNWVELKNLILRDGKGLIRVAGGLGLESWIPKRARMALLVKNFPIQREGVPLAWLSGNAALETELMKYRAGTSLLIESLEIVLPENLGRSVRSLDPHRDITVLGAAVRSEREDSSYAIQFNVDGSNTFIKVRRSDFVAFLNTELDVIYLAPELRVAGNVDFKQGEFEVFGKKFTINGGGLTFNGSSELDPEVSLKATHTPFRGESTRVMVDVSGTLSKPKVSFISDDCEGEEGALTLLMTGFCSVSERESIDQDTAAQRDAFGIALLGGVLTLGTTGIRRQMGDLLPTLSVDTPTTDQGQKEYRIRAGVNADSLIPQFIRPIVRHAYLQGAVTAASESEEEDSSGFDTPDFLLELRFPYSIVWTGRVSPEQWGSDLTWEP